MNERSREEIRGENLVALRKLKGDGTLMVFGLLRNYIEHENQLVDHRTSWLLTLNSFLFAAAALILSTDVSVLLFPPLVLKVYLLLLCIVGFGSAIIAYNGIMAAVDASKALKDTWVDKFEPLSKELGLKEGHRKVDDYDFDEIRKTEFRNDPTRPLPYIQGGGGRFSTAKNGRRFANALPVMIAATWAIFGLTVLLIR